MNHPEKQDAERTPGAAKTLPGKGAPKLDLSGLDAPAHLSECSIEEVTIDGICGVY